PVAGSGAWFAPNGPNAVAASVDRSRPNKGSNALWRPAILNRRLSDVVYASHHARRLLAAFENRLELVEVFLQARTDHGAQKWPEQAHPALRLQLDGVGKHRPGSRAVRTHRSAAAEATDRARTLESIRDAGIDIGHHRVGDIIATRGPDNLMDPRTRRRWPRRVGGHLTKPLPPLEIKSVVGDRVPHRDRRLVDLHRLFHPNRRAHRVALPRDSRPRQCPAIHAQWQARTGVPQPRTTCSSPR